MPETANPLAALIGETLTDVQGMTVGSEEVTLTTQSGRTFRLYHSQDCCETVNVNEVIGEPADLIGVPLLMAEEVSNEGGEGADPKPNEYADSWTWTFYKFGTVRGYVTLRWLGESNGYYSESVYFDEVTR